jgi:hypothetical protein
MFQLEGRYKGQVRIRPGKEGELTKQELARLKKGGEIVELELRPDGRFRWKGSFDGAYKAMGALVRFTPEKFGGQTVEQMRMRSEEMGRTFGLAFIFNPFDLRIEGECLVTTDDDSPIFTEYRRVP